MNNHYGRHDLEPYYYMSSWAANDGNCNYVPMAVRDYQEYGIERLIKMKRQQNRDAPGLGKTMQTAFAANEVGKHILVLAPNNLTGQWEDWLRGEDELSLERCNGQAWQNVDGTIVNAARGNRWKRIEALRKRARWTVASHEMCRTHLKWLLKYNYDTVILDESHHGRNRKAEKAKGMLEVCKSAKYVFQASATVIWREADDLYHQFKMLSPDLFKSYNAFCHMFMDLEDEDGFDIKVKGVKPEMMPELRNLLELMGYGRDYQTAGRQLPPVIEKYIKIDLPEDVRKMYSEAVNFYRIQAMDENFNSWIAVYHALRKIVTGHFKHEAVSELLSDEVRKAVVFVWYKDTADGVVEALGSDFIVPVTGDYTLEERRRRALGAKHVVANIPSIQEGIDLSDARTVIFAEENWTPGSNYQAVSRVVRERQGGNNEEPVVVYYVHCKNTIDEVIHRRSRSRSGTVKELIKEALYL